MKEWKTERVCVKEKRRERASRNGKRDDARTKWTILSPAASMPMLMPMPMTSHCFIFLRETP